jgi:hypothetical protein
MILCSTNLHQGAIFWTCSKWNACEQKNTSFLGSPNSNQRKQKSARKNSRLQQTVSYYDRFAKCILDILRYNIRQTRMQEIAGTCQKNTKAFEEFFAALYKPLTPFLPSSPLLSPSDHSSVTTPVMKSHPYSNLSSTLRSETSATSLDEGMTSLEESDDDLSVENLSEGELPQSETNEGDLRVRFKVPKIHIPTSRHVQYLI